MKRTHSFGYKRVASLGMAVLVLVGTMCAQQGTPTSGIGPVSGTIRLPPTQPGNTEVGFFVGGSHGLDSWRVMGGGNVAYAVTRHIMPYAEFSYFPGISREYSSSQGKVSYNVRLTDLHGGVHIRFPVGESKIIPYAVVGAGIINSGSAPVQITFADGFKISDTVKGSTDFALNFGGGLRFYTSSHVGFRFEGKVYKPTGTYTTPFYKMEAGVFYQFTKARLN